MELHEVQVKWPVEFDLPVRSANQFAVQLSNGPDGVPEQALLAAGFVAPPLLTGTPESQLEQVRSITELQVTPIALMAMSRARVQELITALTQTLTAWDAAIQAREGETR